MNYCDCSYCITQPKNAERNDNCLVTKLKRDCKDAFPEWAFVDSFNAQTKESGLCIVKYMGKFNGLTDTQKLSLENNGYKILDVNVYPPDDDDIMHQDGNDYCECDTCTGSVDEKTKVVIDVKEKPIGSRDEVKSLFDYIIKDSNWKLGMKMKDGVVYPCFTDRHN